MRAHSSVDRGQSLDLDSTQTVRAITSSELYDSRRPKWYAVQLVVSDKSINLDMMPRLEVFAAHQLYAIAAKQETGTWHALRLGFFPDEQSAEVICGYLQTFFSSPSIVRVSEAEQTRFAPQAPPRASVKQAASIPVSAPAAPRAAVALKPTVASKPRAAGAAAGAKKTKTLAEQLLDEAREVELSQSGIRKLPKNNSLLSKLVGKLTK